MITMQAGCLDDPRALWDERICLHAVSKDLRGELRLVEHDRQTCEEQRCRTLKTDHLLRVEVQAHEPCDSKPSRALDGVLYVRRLITAFADGSGQNRGPHTGHFVWVGSDVRVHGTLSGMTNVGTHREPAFDRCQECHAPGFMEGRLCGRVVRTRVKALRGCRVTAAYRFQFDPSEDAQSTGLRGTLEGVIVCRCGQRGCLELSSFPAMSHGNPWTVGGHTFQVRDHAGAPAPTADVVTWGGFTGLNAGYETRIALAAPADSIDIDLVHFAAAGTVTALDDAGNVVDTQSLPAAGGVTTTLHLSGGGIHALLVRAPNDETLILKLCTS